MLPNSKLPRSKPEEQGVLSSGILAFLEAVERQSQGKKNQELHSFMLVRHGYVIAEGWWAPYRLQYPHMLFSLSKSFTSTAIGLAVSEGLLSVEDFVVSFFPEEVPKEPGENLASMRVRHLLSMSTGNKEDTMQSLMEEKDGNWVRGFFSVPVEYLPGTHFLYNTGATYMLSAILQKVTGQTLMQYLQPRLFEPLGIEDATWETCPRGIHVGGFGLSIKTEDIAKFGQLYLQKGYWKGSQIVPKEWVEEATRSQISNGTKANSDWAQGYGYQFWRCRNNAYRGDGAFGQYCVVMPEQDAVIAITSGLDDMQVVLNLVWEYLLPAMESTPLPETSVDQRALEKKLSSLALALPEGLEVDPITAKVSGIRYELEQNGFNFTETSLSFNEDRCVITIQDNTTVYEIDCGIGKWLESEVPLAGNLSRVAACGAWSGNAAFTVDIRFIETPYCNTVTYTFEGDRLLLEINTNVSFDPKEPQLIKGRTA